MWGLFSTSNYLTIANECLKWIIFCLGLLDNQEDLLIAVYDSYIFLCIFDPFSSLSPLQYGITLGALDDCWEKRTLFRFDMYQNPLETGNVCNS